MATILIPETMQQVKEPPLVEVVSDDENISPVHEFPHEYVCHEQSMEFNNSMKTPSHGFTENLSPLHSEQKPSFTVDSLPGCGKRNLKHSTQKLFEKNLAQLEEKLEESQ